MKFVTAILALVLFLSANSLLAQSNWETHDSPVEADLHNITFASDSVGWMITHNTGTVIHTQDGGDSWFIQARLDSITLEDIYFLDKKTGWISGENGLIWKTTDGGKTWEKNKISKKDSWIYSIYFFSEDKGIAVGLHENKPITLFLQTTDGGDTWKDIRNKVPVSFYEPIHFVNDDEGYVGGLNKIIFTNDKGNNWQTQFINNKSNPNCREVIREITFKNLQNGWAVGHCGLVLETKDGTSWKRHEKFTENILRDILFIRDSEGYIVGDGNKEEVVLYHTNDGGKTWVPALKNSPDLHRIEFNDKKIWAIGDNGTIISKEI